VQWARFAVSAACPVDCALFHKGTSVGLQGREQGEQGELYRGFGDSLSRSFELALTPPIFAAFGYLLDRLLGIVPVLTIVFFLTAMIGLIATMWYGYDARMKVHEQDGPWAEHSQGQDR